MKTGLAILASAAALLAGTHLLHRPEATLPSVPQTGAKPIVLGTSPARSSIARTVRPVAERDQGTRPTQATPGATRIARRFLAAYMRWQRGAGDAPTLHALQATASQRLWRELNSGATLPDPDQKVPVERLHRLIRGAAGTERSSTMLAELERRHALGSLAIVLHRRANRWRVTSLTP